MKTLIDEGRRAGLSSDFIADRIDHRVTRYLETVGQRGEGDRNATAYRIAVWLSNDFGLSDDVAWGYLAHWNQDNTPPLLEHELRLVFRSARKGGSRPAGVAHGPRGSAA
jgi:hypothetical protein